MRIKEAWGVREKELTELEDLYQNHKVRFNQLIDELGLLKVSLQSKTEEYDQFSQQKNQELHLSQEAIQNLDDNLKALEDHNKELSTALSLASESVERERQAKERLQAETDKHIAQLNEEQSALREQISERVQAFSKERDELEQQLLDKSNQLQQHEQELEQVKDDVLRLRAEKEEQQAHAERERDDLELSHGQELASRDQRITDLHADLETVQAELAEVNADAHRLNEELAAQIEESNRLSLLLSEREKEIDALNQQGDLLRGQLQAAHDQIAALIQERDEGFDERDKHVLQLGQDLNRTQQDLSERNSELDDRNQHIVRLDEQLSALRFNLNEAAALQRQTEEDKKRGFLERDQELHQRNRELEELRALLSERENDLVAAHQLLDETRGQLRATEEHVTTLLDERDSGFLERDTEIATLKQEKDQAIHDWSAKYITEQQLAQKQTARAEQAEDKVAALKETLDALKEEMAERSLQFDALSADLRAAHEQHRNMIADWQSREVELMSEIDNSKEQLAVTESQLNHFVAENNRFKDVHVKTKKALELARIVLKEPLSTHTAN